MKRLLLVLLFGATVVTVAGQAPVVSASGMCASGQVSMGIYYYEYPGGLECGLTYIYCDGTPRYHEGCATATYNQENYCSCP